MVSLAQKTLLISVSRNYCILPELKIGMSNIETTTCVFMSHVKDDALRKHSRFHYDARAGSILADRHGDLTLCRLCPEQQDWPNSSPESWQVAACSSHPAAPGPWWC